MSHPGVRFLQVTSVEAEDAYCFIMTYKIWCQTYARLQITPPFPLPRGVSTRAVFYVFHAAKALTVSMVSSVVKPDATLCRSTRIVVLHSETLEDPYGTVVHPYRDKYVQFPHRFPQKTYGWPHRAGPEQS